MEDEEDSNDHEMIKVENTTPHAGKLNVYKSGRLFLFVDLLPQSFVSLPLQPKLFFGLTKKAIKEGDSFDSKKEKLFSPLAELNRKYFTNGIIVNISDNPAGRPHVNIDRLEEKS